ncbi:phenylacetate--CoA ligase family protein [Actinosynnema sp. NPDC053489]|uniref:phenylacetate--CoA ligase family protein n=1 Tax=Actinosynnema sp. NPDC053489 TaxID=3363916 RepID=UPI0037C55C01
MSGTAQGTRAIRDVEGEATTGDAIAPYIRRNDRAVRETWEAQVRLRAKWDQQKHRVRARLRLDPEELDAWQLDRVRVLVDTAYTTIPFYRELYSSVGFEPGDIVTWDDFRRLPLVDKRALVEADVGEQVLRTAGGRTVHSARTSGSSGLNLTIYQDNASVDYRAVLYVRHCELVLGAPLRPEDWRYSVYFAAERFSSMAGEYPFLTVSQDCPTDVLLDHLARVRPRLLLAFPGYLQRLAAHGVELTRFGIDAVGTNSERSSVEERVRYSEVFGVPVLDEYSSEEFSMLAHECRERRYHLTEDSAYVEVADADESGFGHLVATSLGNSFMPFIRYDQGDVVRLADTGQRCPCGTRFRSLAAFRGREDESLRDGPTRRVPADAVLGLCDRTLVVLESNVRQYQIAQVSPDRVELRYQPLERGRDDRSNPLVAGFAAELPSLFHHVRLRVDVVEVDDFATFASGKRRLIVTEGDWAARPEGRG